MNQNEKTPGHMIATAVAGSWRNSAGPLSLSLSGLKEITPLLMQSGAGALAWWLIRNSTLADSVEGTQLRETYRLHRLQAVIHRRKIKQVIGLLRESDIEPVLMKGWSVARLYPEPGLRHYIDVDLCVAPDQYARADDVLKRGLGAERSYVDLHSALGHLDNMAWDDLWAHSEVVDLDDTIVRVLGPEDHLRVLCTHWLGHGAWRPAGLCDVAAALESRNVSFNWQRCLGADPKRADWVACTIGLAHQLLGAEVDDTPIAARAKSFPRWLVPAVLRQWTRCVGPNGNGMALPALLREVRQPSRFCREVYARWDNPVHATVELDGSFNDWSRLPYQIAALALRVPEIPRQLALIIRERWQQWMRGTEVTDSQQTILNSVS